MPLAAAWQDGGDSARDVMRSATGAATLRRVTSADDPVGWLGSTIDDRFVVEELVGEGGFGLVYRGKHLGLAEPVGIKVLKLPSKLTEKEQETFLEEFRKEARLLHKLSRKTAGIVQALDLGAATSPKGVWTPYMVMEWLDGTTLEEQILHGIDEDLPCPTLEEAVALLTPVAESLAVAHSERVAHLDIKPANIFLLRDGGIKLLDFGIAKALTASDTVTQALTRSGTLPPFTPAYGAPEQFNPRHGKTGPWTDVFALALVLIEVCSRDMALQGETPIQLYVASANEQHRPSLVEHGVRVSQQVEDVFRRAVEVDPRRRFPTADAMWNALRRATEIASISAGVTARVSVVPSRGSEASELAETARPTSTTPRAGMSRLCTVLFCELDGGAATEHLAAEQLSELLERSLTAVQDAITDLGGTVERRLGDELMAYFGLYDDSATAAERAVHAALRCEVALAELSDRFRLSDALRPSSRVAITTGRVVVSPQQHTGTFTLSASGAPLKLGARLKRDADDGDVIVDRDTFRQVSGLFDAEARRPRSSRRGTASVCYRIKGMASSRHALDVQSARAFHGVATRFVGRMAEMESLVNAAGLASEDRHARLVTLIGAPGIGRSRILAELAEQLVRRDWILFTASCSAVHQRASYALAAALLRSRFHIHDDDGREVVAAKLRRGLRVMSGRGSRDSEHGILDFVTGRVLDIVDEDEIVEQLMRLLGLRDEQDDAPAYQDETSAAKHRVAAAFAGMLAPARGPVAILCDDVHWADESSLSLLVDICARITETPVFVVVGARPELLDRFPLWGEGESYHQRLQLAPLGRRYLEEMTRDRLQRISSLSGERVRRIAEHAEGNPLTLVETLHLLIDTGTIETTGDSWVLHDDRYGELELPPTVQGVVQARLDRLDESARLALANAALIGATFWDGLLADLLEMEAPALDDQLEALRDRSLVRARAASTFPDQREYVFAESSTQRVAYEMLNREERRRLHSLVARWLEQRSPSGAGAARIASHFEQAAALPEALASYRSAAAHAASLGQNAEALDCYEKAFRIDEGDVADEVGGDYAVRQAAQRVGEALLARLQPLLRTRTGHRHLHGRL